MQFVSISMISRAANVFAARLVRHRPAACEFSREPFDLVYMHGDNTFLHTLHTITWAQQL